jgi:alpha-glucuronidase
VRPRDDDGYRLWLRYEPITNATRLAEARAAFAAVFMPAPTPMLVAARDELARGLTGLLAANVSFCDTAADATLIVGTPRAAFGLRNEQIGDESPLFSLFLMAPGGYVIDRVSAGGSAPALAVAGLPDEGVLYGVFHLLRHLQMGRPLAQIATTSGPRAGLRMLDHWDNLDGSIERGYAGRSLWQWDDLPGKVDARYTDYARANASIGINAVALNNVNASARTLTPEHLGKVAALANVFRPWGIRVFLAARFSAPVELAGLANADPRDERVAAWWRAKARRPKCWPGHFAVSSAFAPSTTSGIADEAGKSKSRRDDVKTAQRFNAGLRDARNKVP